jgi:hypothetical protein
MIEQVNQGGPNGIIVTSTWSNSVPEQAQQLIIEKEQPGDSAHLPGGSVDLKERILVCPSRVEKLSTKRSRTIKRKPQSISKVLEIGGALIRARHPLESALIIIHYHERQLELNDQLLVIVTLNREQLSETHPLNHLKSIIKLRFLLEMIHINSTHSPQRIPKIHVDILMNVHMLIAPIQAAFNRLVMILIHIEILVMDPMEVHVYHAQVVRPNYLALPLAFPSNFCHGLLFLCLLGLHTSSLRLLPLLMFPTCRSILHPVLSHKHLPLPVPRVRLRGGTCEVSKGDSIWMR